MRKVIKSQLGGVDGEKISNDIIEQITNATENLKKVGAFDTDVGEYIKNLIVDFNQLSDDKINQSSEINDKKNGDNNIADKVFVWTPINPPASATTKTITFTIHIPSRWPNFNIPDLAAFQVLYYFTVLQKFIYKVQGSPTGTDWLKKTYNGSSGSSGSSGSEQWEIAIKEAQEDINEHQILFTYYKTEMTYTDYKAAKITPSLSATPNESGANVAPITGGDPAKFVALAAVAAHVFSRTNQSE